MKRRITGMLAVVGTGVFVLSAAGAADMNAEKALAVLSPKIDAPAGVLSDGAYHDSQALVRFNAGTDAKTRDAVLARAGAGVILASYTIVPDLYLVQVPAGRVDAVIGALAKVKSVRYAERDYYMFALAQTEPYGIGYVKAPQVWPQTRGSGVKVAVLDTGVDLTHEDLPTPVAMQSFISGEAVQDNHGHGTHCSGTVLAIDNTVGVIGVAPEASLMIGKVLANSGNGPTSGVISGVQWANDNGAHVISMSLGGGAFTQSFQDTCQAAVDGGIVVVAAAGNANSATPSYPGAYTPVICVAAIGSDFLKASYSNFGPHVDVCAPGSGVYSTISGTIPSTDSTVVWNATPRAATPMTGTPVGTVTAQVINCNVGNVSDFTPAVAGKIAHVRRGGTSTATGQNLTFQEKANNAIAAGATGVIISNNVSGTLSGTLNQSVSVPVVGVLQIDGDALVAANPAVTATITVLGGELYGTKSGTSMATPHVAGVAALVRASASPRVPTALQIRQAIEETCQDLGDPGRDDLYGMGLVNAQAAAARLAQIMGPSCVADIASDDGVPLPNNHSNGGVNEGDYNAFFMGFFEAAAYCNIADDEGNSPAVQGNPNGGVNEGDYNAFFMHFFEGCA